MYLKELRLNGFKSFADPTRLQYIPGVTAVVGPNGCGKSNIADAIRWVLGEQSAKALRGGKMQDVIFEGTDDRKPLQLCEVTLLFTECETHLGTAFNEVEITRRVSRDAQSDYLINGKPCRLRDIQQIFMDTGIGRTSYSIMAQGQIDQILSSNPNERRAIFEEAAGITKYKSQRREALNKLKLVEANLSRLTDVIDEVRRQINSLKRQASKALRYKRLRFRLRHFELAWGAFQHNELATAIAEVEEKAKGLSKRVEECRERLSGRESEIDEKKAERSRANERLQESQQRVFEIRSNAEQARNRVRLADARRADLSSRLEEAESEIFSVESQLADLTKQTEGNIQVKQEQMHLVGSSDEVFQLRNQELESIQRELTETEKTLGQEKHNLLRFENDVTRFRSQCSAMEVDLKSSAMRQASLKDELAEVEGDLKAATENMASIQKAIEDIRTQVESAQTTLDASREEVNRRRDAFRAKQREIQEADRGIAQNTARLRVLRQLQEKLEGFSDGAKALLQGKLDHALPENAGSRRPLAVDTSIDPESTKAIESLMGAALDAVAVEEADVALTVIELLEQQKLGKACLQYPVFGRNGTGDAASLDLPAFIRPAAAAILQEEEDGGVHPLKHLMHGCYVTDSISDFFTYWRENPEFDFRFAATPKGELIDARGLVFGGFSKGKGGSVLRRGSEIRELTADIADQQKTLERLRKEADKEQEALTEAENAVEAANAQVMEIAQKRSGLEAEERGAVRSRDEVAARLERLRREREESEKREETARAEMEKAQTRFREAEELHEGQKKKISGIEKQLDHLREERERKREALSDVRLDLAEKRQRLEVLDRGLHEMERRRSELQAALKSRRDEIASIREQLENLHREKEEQEKVAERAAGDLEEATGTVEKMRSAFAALDSEISEIEMELAAKRQEAGGAQSELNRLEVRLAEQRSKAGFIEEEMRREYQIEISRVDWRETLWHAEDEPEGPAPLDLEEEDADGAPKKGEGKIRGPITDEGRAEMDRTDWNEIKTEIQALRSRIQSMGPVNLVAIEEYSELKDRFTFLTGQCDDLTNSRDELTKAIEDINNRSQKQFQDIFEQIRKNFAYTFEALFGGGKSDLKLLESEDVLESGVEVIAQPPGTRLTSLVLLSGGQKTMTAVALLFAIYMVKPSPFCILDELDAPLDEANIGRFTAMLQKFTSNSQFIIITHNKRTISEAGAIFGVTMEEKGVSKVVSMRFNREKNTPENAALEVAGKENAGNDI